MCGRHPGRVERVGRVSGRGSPDLAGGLPYPSPPTRAGRGGQEEAGRTSGKSERKRSGRREERENEEDEKKQQTAGRKREAAG